MGHTKKFSRRLKLKRFNSAKLAERKLGRARDRKGKSRYCYGQHHSDGLIEVDPRQREQTRLDTLIHELLHHVNAGLDSDPDHEWSENAICEAAGLFAKVLWEDGWRRVRL